MTDSGKAAAIRAAARVLDSGDATVEVAARAFEDGRWQRVKKIDLDHGLELVTLETDRADVFLPLSEVQAVRVVRPMKRSSVQLDD